MTDCPKDVLEKLIVRFSDLVNDESEDPNAPIDPLTYVDICGDNCLHIAVQRQDVWATENLLECGVDVNAKGDMGSTPLHYARSSGNQEIISILIKHGADQKIKDEFGRLP